MKVTGVVFDVSGNPVAGVPVRLYRRDTGALLATGTTFDGNTTVAATSAWSTIASESGSFTLTSAATVRYGANSSWYTQSLSPGTYTCTTTTFGGDPAYGTSKHCELQGDSVASHVPALGAYEFYGLDYSGEIQVVAVSPDSGDVRNDLIVRTFAVSV